MTNIFHNITVHTHNRYVCYQGNYQGNYEESSFQHANDKKKKKEFFSKHIYSSHAHNLKLLVLILFSLDHAWHLGFYQRQQKICYILFLGPCLILYELASTFSSFVLKPLNFGLLALQIFSQQYLPLRLFVSSRFWRLSSA